MMLGESKALSASMAYRPSFLRRKMALGPRVILENLLVGFGNSCESMSWLSGRKLESRKWKCCNTPDMLDVDPVNLVSIFLVSAKSSSSLDEVLYSLNAEKLNSLTFMIFSR